MNYNLIISIMPENIIEEWHIQQLRAEWNYHCLKTTLKDGKSNIKSWRKTNIAW
jgi:hypothetical protein